MTRFTRLLTRKNHAVGKKTNHSY